MGERTMNEDVRACVLSTLTRNHVGERISTRPGAYRERIAELIADALEASAVSTPPPVTDEEREDGEVEVGEYPDGKFACDCGRTIRLWWNGGELDRETCECGIQWWGEHASTVLVKRVPTAAQSGGEE